MEKRQIPSTISLAGASMLRTACSLAIALCALPNLIGCDVSSSPDGQPASGTRRSLAEPKTDRTATRRTPEASTKPIEMPRPGRLRTSRLQEDSSTPAGSRNDTVSAKSIGTILNRLIGESVEYAPTLAVWLLDRSASAQGFVREIGQAIAAEAEEIYQCNEDTAAGAPQDARLLSAVCAFGEKATFVLDPPSDRASDLSVALESVPLDNSGREATFAAIRAATDRYLPYRTQLRREVLFILITDEAGDDDQLVDQVLQVPRAHGIAVFVVGVPAPLGRRQALDDRAEPPSRASVEGNWRPIAQGPESRQVERIQLGFPAGASNLELLDSGFGPFALERICRATGGCFLAIRPAADELRFSRATVTEWPTSNLKRFGPSVMVRYAPDYDSGAQYQRLLESSPTRQALIAAGRLPPIESIDLPRREFVVTTEARMAQELSRSQQVAARLEPAINQLYETLEQGEADRDRLDGPRWQAGYDLAFGRAAAAKVRIEGYNAMLAALKRGRTFEDPSSTRWVLEPADTIEASSALQKLLTKAAMYLDRVIREHPGTPWALLAEREREIPLGWRWTEQ
jgi:hypothetical protein